MFEHKHINFEALNKKAYNLRWANVPEGVIPLTAADPDFPCAPEIAEDVQRYAAERYFSYAPAEGFLFFREAAAQFYASKRNYKVSPEYILPIDSAAFGIHLVCKTFLQPGDEAIIFDPVDFLFKFSIVDQGATAIPFKVPIDPIEELDYEKLESLISAKTKMICLCNPLNPTGKVFTKEELKKIGQIAVKHKLVIMSDEIWSDIVFSPSTYTSIAAIDSSIENHTIVINGFSKSYALAGLRIGMLATTNTEYFKKLFDASLHGATIHGANVLAQVAATTALTKCDNWLNEFIQHLHGIRALGMEKINQINGFSCYAPQGCYLFFCNITQTGYSSSELSDLLLEKAKVYVVPGLPRWFGDAAEGYIRICFSTSVEVFEEAMNRIKNTIQTP